MRLTKTEKRTILFLTLLLVITVGYALLSQTLNINGTTNIKKTTWSIIWDNVVVNENSVKGDSVTTAAAITNTEKTLVEYSISLKEPGEFYEFTVDAKNTGTIDGMVNTVSNKVYESNGTTEKTLPEYLTYTVTYSDGKTIEPKHLLSAGSTEKYKVRVEFKDVSADKLPSSEETIKFKFSVDYVQADDTAEAVIHGLTGTKYRTLPYHQIDIGDNVSEGVTLFDSVAEAKAAFNNKPFYLKHTIENDIVKDSYVCFEKDGNDYCLRGQETGENSTGTWKCKSEFYDAVNDKCLSTYYEPNKTILKNAFGESNCTNTTAGLVCNAGDLYANVTEYGNVNAYDGSTGCNASDDGSSSCSEEWG